MHTNTFDEIFADHAAEVRALREVLIYQLASAEHAVTQALWAIGAESW